MHNKCNVLESSQNHLSPHPPSPPQSMEKLSSTKLVPGAKKVGDHCLSLLFAVTVAQTFLVFDELEGFVYWSGILENVFKFGFVLCFSHS